MPQPFQTVTLFQFYQLFNDQESNITKVISLHPFQKVHNSRNVANITSSLKLKTDVKGQM